MRHIPAPPDHRRQTARLERDIERLEEENAALRQAVLTGAADTLRSAILDVALDSVIASDRNGCIIEWNRAAEQTFGYARDEALGRNMSELIIPPELRHRHREGMRRYLETGEGPLLGRRIELEALHADGRRFSVELAISPIHVNGELQFTASLRDIGARARAAADLKESEARYRLIADHATDMIVRIGPDGMRRYVSPASRDVLGFAPEELVGTRVQDTLHADDLAGIATHLDDLFSGRPAPLTSTYRVRHKQGHWVWVEARLRLLVDDTGRPVEAVSVIRDISHRMRLEAQLRQAQKMEAVGQLTGGIAHDFNNLLTVIIGNAEILMRDLAQPEHRRLAELTLVSAERGADLTQKLLTFGRRQSLQPVRLDVNAVIREMMPLIERTIGEDIELRTALRAGPTAAVTDRTLLEGAILNLAVNARDAMPQGGALTIETGERSAGPDDGALPIGQPVVSVTVSDTGCGIAPDILERVFEPFFTTKEVGQGSGLGLAMVYGFAQQSGCHVAIDSSPGRGTSVTILLHAVGSAPNPAAADPGDEHPTLPGRHSVLVVEDDPDVLRFATAQLVSLGHDVTAAATGADALALLQQGRPFDLIMTDIVLPRGMTGIELAERAREVRPGLPVLLVTGYAQEALVRRGGMRGYVVLRKPYRRKNLIAALKDVLAGRPAGATLLSIPQEG